MKNLLMLIIPLRLKELRRILKLLSLKLMIESELLSIKFFSKGYTEDWPKEILIIQSRFKSWLFGSHVFFAFFRK